MFIRKPAVEGSFYPSEIKDVSKIINSFDSQVVLSDKITSVKPKIFISPHAGLFFSGQTATYGYKLVSKFKYNRIVIFAPSHRVYFEGMSGAMYESYFINGKNIAIDKEFTEKISNKFNLEFIESAHKKEHSAEIQFPFINYYFSDTKVAVFVYAEYDYIELSKILNYILDEYDKTLIVISSDLSHFHSYDYCKKIDNKLIEGINKLNIEKISKGEACGMIGIKASVESAKRKKLKTIMLDYKNSGDIIQDKSSVVGYASIIFV